MARSKKTRRKIPHDKVIKMGNSKANNENQKKRENDEGQTGDVSPKDQYTRIINTYITHPEAWWTLSSSDKKQQQAEVSNIILPGMMSDEIYKFDPTVSNYDEAMDFVDVINWYVGKQHEAAMWIREHYSVLWGKLPGGDRELDRARYVLVSLRLSAMTRERIQKLKNKNNISTQYELTELFALNTQNWHNVGITGMTLLTGTEEQTIYKSFTYVQKQLKIIRSLRKFRKTLPRVYQEDLVQLYNKKYGGVRTRCALPAIPPQIFAEVVRELNMEWNNRYTCFDLPASDWNGGEPILLVKDTSVLIQNVVTSEMTPQENGFLESVGDKRLPPLNHEGITPLPWKYFELARIVPNMIDLPDGLIHLLFSTIHNRVPDAPNDKKETVFQILQASLSLENPQQVIYDVCARRYPNYSNHLKANINGREVAQLLYQMSMVLRPLRRQLATKQSPLPKK